AAADVQDRAGRRRLERRSSCGGERVAGLRARSLVVVREIGIQKAAAGALGDSAEVSLRLRQLRAARPASRDDWGHFTLRSLYRRRRESAAADPPAALPFFHG